MIAYRGVWRGLNPNNSRSRGRQGWHSARTLHQSPLTTTWSQQLREDLTDYPREVAILVMITNALPPLAVLCFEEET